jgi:integrase
MAVYKQKNGKAWSMRFSYKGERFDQSTGFANKRAAEDYERAFRTKLINGEVGIKTKKDVPNFKAAVADFLEWSESRQAETTFKRYAGATKALISHFGDQRVDRITVTDVENFMTKRSKEFCAPRGIKPKSGNAPKRNIEKQIISKSTVNKELACLKKMFSRLVAAETLSFNPVKQIEFFEEDNEAGRVINYEEERLYLMAASQPLQDYVTVLVETGLRPDELCRVTLQDVFIGGDRPCLMVRKGKTKAATRTVPLSERAARVLSQRIEGAKGKYLFAGGRGGKNLDAPVLKFNNAHYGTLNRCKIDAKNRSGTSGTCKLYSFRHTFATRFLESEGDLLTLAALLGHSSLRMVMRYAHPSETHKFDAIKRMEEKRNNAARIAA